MQPLMSQPEIKIPPSLETSKSARWRKEMFPYYLMLSNSFQWQLCHAPSAPRTAEQHVRWSCFPWTPGDVGFQDYLHQKRAGLEESKILDAVWGSKKVHCISSALQTNSSTPSLSSSPLAHQSAVKTFQFNFTVKKILTNCNPIVWLSFFFPLPFPHPSFSEWLWRWHLYFWIKTTFAQYCRGGRQGQKREEKLLFSSSQWPLTCQGQAPNNF